MTEYIPQELLDVAEFLGGEAVKCSDGDLYIRIDTGDNTSKENYDDLLGIEEDLEHILKKYEVGDLWADHDTQTIDFKEKE